MIAIAKRVEIHGSVTELKVHRVTFRRCQQEIAVERRILAGDGSLVYGLEPLPELDEQSLEARFARVTDGGLGEAVDL